jgi:hypothetical protein
MRVSCDRVDDGCGSAAVPRRSTPVLGASRHREAAVARNGDVRVGEPPKSSDWATFGWPIRRSLRAPDPPRGTGGVAPPAEPVATPSCRFGNFGREFASQRAVTKLARLSLTLLLTTPVFADAMTDLRTSLRGLAAHEPIRCTYEVQRTQASEGKFDNDKFTGKLAVELEADANGLRISLPKTLLEQVGREQDAEARNPKENMPTVTALNELEPVEAAEALDFAPVLLRMLEGAKVVTDGPGTLGGKPVRVMIFRLADEPHEGPGKLTIAENKLTLWLAPDLVPLAAEHLAGGKFSFLVFRGESKQKQSWHLTRVADRLVVGRREFSRSSSGMGQKENESVVAVVRVR